MEQSKMLKKVASFLLFAVSIFLISCGFQSAETVSAKQLNEFVNGPTGYYSTLFSGIFYAGTEGGYDYVVIKRGNRAVKKFKVRVGEIVIQHPMQLERQEERWTDITSTFPVPGTSPVTSPK